jgi:hypothetical protein
MPPPDGMGRGPPLERERRLATNETPDHKADWTSAVSNIAETESPAGRAVDEDDWRGGPVTMEIAPGRSVTYNIDENGDPITEEDAECIRQVTEAICADIARWGAEQREAQEARERDELMQMALDLAVGGRLRPYVPYEPVWCRTIGDRFVTLFTMGQGMVNNFWQLKKLSDLHRAVEQFEAAGRRAVDPTKDGVR